jgi:pimeloyl-ACP methyl ester carboxylesterase
VTSPIDSLAPAKTMRLHGHTVSYRGGGTGPLLVLVHGITSSSANWEPVLPLLTEHFTVLAPDLLGHGASAKPRGDYSLGAYACLIRDLMAALGHERATVVGHSLGGGVAMQLAYQFPERVERLVLVSSGGLGREVSLLLRAATLPLSELVLPLLASSPLIDAGTKIGSVLGKIGLGVRSDWAEMARGFASLHDIEARRAFVHTARAVIDAGGQRVAATDRLYLAEAVPTLIMWGARDPIIPSTHGADAHGLMPGSRLEMFERAGHFPHHDEPIAFARTLRDFVETTEPAVADEDRIRELLLAHAS